MASWKARERLSHGSGVWMQLIVAMEERSLGLADQLKLEHRPLDVVTLQGAWDSAGPWELSCPHRFQDIPLEY